MIDTNYCLSYIDSQQSTCKSAVNNSWSRKVSEVKSRLICRQIIFQSYESRLLALVAVSTTVTLTLVLLRVFPKHIFLRGGVVATPPLDYQYRRSYNPKFTTNV